MKKHILILLSCIALTAYSQEITQNHDESKMNQIKVMEIGDGSLTPWFYYWLFHNSYRDEAAETNKITYRSLASVAGYNQVPYADSIESNLKSRAAIEALNVADRSGGALDIAWAAEGSKIENALSKYQSNIGRIMMAGGSRDDKSRWEEYYNVFQTAVNATKDAYMPNSQRKKQYLKIYKDIVTQNDILVKHIVQLQTLKSTKEYLASRNTITSHKQQFATEAHNRWLSNAWNRTGKTSSGGSGSNDGSTEGVGR